MGQSAQMGSMINFLPLVFIFIIFYFLIIRPQKNQEKERQKMLNNVAKNDEIVTTGGIHATVVSVKDKTAIIRIDDNVKVELEKNCIAHVKKPAGQTQGN